MCSRVFKLPLCVSHLGSKLDVFSFRHRHHCTQCVAHMTLLQVLDVCGDPIPGLYATGEVVGGVHGADHLVGCSCVDCLVFGRIAGKNVAAEPAAEAHVETHEKQQQSIASHSV